MIVIDSSALIAILRRECGRTPDETALVPVGNNCFERCHDRSIYVMPGEGRASTTLPGAARKSWMARLRGP